MNGYFSLDMLRYKLRKQTGEKQNHRLFIVNLTLRLKKPLLFCDVCECRHVHTCTVACLWRSEGNPQGGFLSFH